MSDPSSSSSSGVSPADTTLLTKSLIDVNDSVLVVIDVQEFFLDKLSQAAKHETATSLLFASCYPPPPDKESLVNRIGWIMDVANILNVPMILTAEDIDTLGSVTTPLQGKLSADSVSMIHNKMIFGMADCNAIMESLKQTKRNTVILVGLETDVCITHSAIGLAKLGYNVAVLADATATPAIAQHVMGLDRMKQAGININHVKGLYYEWVRTVAKGNEIREKHLQHIGTPKGIIL